MNVLCIILHTFPQNSADLVALVTLGEEDILLVFRKFDYTGEPERSKKRTLVWLKVQGVGLRGGSID